MIVISESEDGPVNHTSRMKADTSNCLRGLIVFYFRLAVNVGRIRSVHDSGVGGRLRRGMPWRLPGRSTNPD